MRNIQSVDFIKSFLLIIIYKRIEFINSILHFEAPAGAYTVKFHMGQMNYRLHHFFWQKKTASSLKVGV